KKKKKKKAKAKAVCTRDISTRFWINLGIISCAMEALGEIACRHPQLMYGGLVATTCAAAALIYRTVTRKRPTHVRVNCWFCCQDTQVPYGNRNCWDCPNCEQYNGFQENGDYNKPIPAQYFEHLNHGVSPGFSRHESSQKARWVGCQMLLCKKCNNNQALKIRQLATFMPRDEDKYDEEIEVYRHHLEQTYRLCRQCLAAAEYYIKHQNRQLRAVLFNPQVRHSRDADIAFVKNTYSIPTPMRVILLRVATFLAAVFLVLVGMCRSGDPSAPSNTLHSNSSSSAPDNSTALPLGNNSGGGVWGGLMGLVPDGVLQNGRSMLIFGRTHQMGVISLGLLTCISGILLAGPVRLRRIDAVASMLWFLLLTLHLLESYLKTDITDSLDTIKFGALSLCCLVAFAAAMATRQSTAQRRTRGRRFLSGSSVSSFCSSQALPSLAPLLSEASAFVPTPPPNLSHLLSRQLSHRTRKASPSSLPGRLSRALSLGTIPSLARTDSGYLFSGSRPSSRCKDSPPSDYFSLKSVSGPSSVGTSPAPSVAGSITSTSSSARQRRPLISPARLKLGSTRLQLFPSPLSPPPCPSDHTTFCSRGIPLENSTLPSPSRDVRSVLEDSPVFVEGGMFEREGGVGERSRSTSASSACLVDTTTGPGAADPKWKGVLGCSLWPGLLCISLTANLVFTFLYMYAT
ncbi:hypothetical protein GJAV_G00187910, partial [Gymnothorax javanicus]